MEEKVESNKEAKGSRNPFQLLRENKYQIDQFIRMKFHTYLVTAIYAFLIVVLLPSAILSYLVIVTDISLPTFFIRYDRIHWFWLFLSLNLPLVTWLYSTITQPIKKGYTIIIDWKQTVKGRNLSAIVSGIPFFVISWAVCARYIADHYAEPLMSVDVSTTHPHLMFTDFGSLLGILYALPIIGTGFVLFLGIRHFMKYEDIREQFYEWEFAPLSRVAFSLEDETADVIIGWEKETDKPIVLKENERFIHKLVNGATGSGKTSTQLLVEITQDLVRIARGQKLSVVMLEPKGDAVADILEICEELNIPKEKIKVVDPTDAVRSIKFNPFMGPLESAAESFRGTLDSLTGDQDAFFKGQQGETAAMFTMLAKLRYHNRANILHIQQMFTDARYLADMAEEVRNEITKRTNERSIHKESLVARLDALIAGNGEPQERLRVEEEIQSTQADMNQLEKHARIVSYFEDEVLEYKTYREQKTGDIFPVKYTNGKYRDRQMVENKKDKFITGAKKYLNDIAMNSMMTNLMVANDDEALDLDSFLNEGGVLLVNSALGELEELSLLLGQFFTRQFQSAVFRRPSEKDGNYKRIPTFFTIDEFPLYANEAFERFLTLGRSYKVGVTIAIQSLGQLERIVAGYRQVIMANSSTKVVFGRGVYDDNLIFSNEFGEEYEYEESLNESTTPVTVGDPSWSYRHNTQRILAARFTPTQIRELKFKHMVVQTVKEDGSAGPPVLAYGKFLNETDFIDKYLDVSTLTLKTRHSTALNIASAVTQLKGLISSKPMNDETPPETEPLERTSRNNEETRGEAEDSIEYGDRQDEVAPSSVDEDYYSGLNNDLEDKEAITVSTSTPVAAVAPKAQQLSFFDGTEEGNENVDLQNESSKKEEVAKELVAMKVPKKKHDSKAEQTSFLPPDESLSADKQEQQKDSTPTSEPSYSTTPVVDDHVAVSTDKANLGQTELDITVQEKSNHEESTTLEDNQDTDSEEDLPFGSGSNQGAGVVYTNSEPDEEANKNVNKLIESLHPEEAPTDTTVHTEEKFPIEADPVGTSAIKGEAIHTISESLSEVQSMGEEQDDL